jgi:hypothetical protein
LVTALKREGGESSLGEWGSEAKPKVQKAVPHREDSCPFGSEVRWRSRNATLPSPDSRDARPLRHPEPILDRPRRERSARRDRFPEAIMRSVGSESNGRTRDPSLQMCADSITGLHHYRAGQGGRSMSSSDRWRLCRSIDTTSFAVTQPNSSQPSESRSSRGLTGWMSPSRRCSVRDQRS